MLGQRRRRWANVKTTLVYCIVFAGRVQINRLPNGYMINIMF